ncbi:MAG: hypothetical protein BGO51_15245 [Rhodospirillales bacterium 69-11]|nr:MAG: hypothetical protein BGO51_15245 [Rhodospirillales bacterium 69-11]
MNAGGLLLDTCALIWLLNGDRLTRQAERAVAEAAAREAVLLSPISAWEIALLSRPGQAGRAPLVFLPDPRAWFEQAALRPGIRIVPLCANIAVDAALLPEPFGGDAVDRLLVATARHVGATLATRDSRILAYGEAGLVQVLAC